MQPSHKIRRDGQRLFQRMITRLVWLDVARSFAAALGLLFALQIFIVRYIPPWVIRDEAQRASSSARAWVLPLLLGVYVALTVPLVRVMMGSRRLDVFRHWPVSDETWRWLHAKHLLWLNLPWFGVAAYSLFTGASAPSWSLALGWWLGWCILTVGLQILMWHCPMTLERPLSLVGWLGLFAVLVLLVRNPSLWSALTAFFGGCWMVWWGLFLPPPLQGHRFVPQRVAPRSAVHALFRLEAFTLWRKEQRWLWTVAGMLVGLLGLFALAIVNNKLRDPSVLFAIAVGVMLPGSLLVASVLIRTQRWLSGYSWFSLHLGVRVAHAWLARFLLGWLLSWSVWALLWLTVFLSGTHLPWAWVLALCASCASVAVWATALTIHVCAQAEIKGVLEEPLLWAFAGHLLPPIVLIAFFPWLSFGLCLMGAVYMWRGIQAMQELQHVKSRRPGPRSLISHH
ncbi:MAG: hypothetical protein EP343_24890 [Deltaproteobacteria bacterium]|nr:MAG: hypothetical protein EP343_24890 [Deltaproteobacteria bacterium]